MRESLAAQLNSIDKGKDELNKFIQLFLNRTDICIDVTNDNFFILKRGNKEAKHLSEGEKTAIAFSHFMVQLKSIKDNKTLLSTVVFIDDPISSLDTNHIAQISSLINSFFYEKGIDANNPDKICLCCKQLFITTHNFELFSFLKDASNIKKRDIRYYMVKKETIDSSILTDIPKALSKYKSEYVYLFSEIDKFKNDGCQ
ncbi:MAG: AAA family ATPase [Bacteroidales bacterium]